MENVSKNNFELKSDVSLYFLNFCFYYLLYTLSINQFESNKNAFKKLPSLSGTYKKYFCNASWKSIESEIGNVKINCGCYSYFSTDRHWLLSEFFIGEKLTAEQILISTINGLKNRIIKIIDRNENRIFGAQDEINKKYWQKGTQYSCIIFGLFFFVMTLISYNVYSNLKSNRQIK